MSKPMPDIFPDIKPNERKTVDECNKVRCYFINCCTLLLNKYPHIEKSDVQNYLQGLILDLDKAIHKERKYKNSKGCDL